LVILSSVVPSAAVGANEPTVQVSDADIEVGGTQTVALVLSEAPEGISGFDLQVSVGDSSVAEISSLTVGDFSLPRTNVSDDGQTGFAQGLDSDRNHEPGATNVTLVNVTLEGQATGRTTLTIDGTNIDDDAGNDVNPALETVTIVVGSPQTTPTPTPGQNNTTTPNETTTAASGGGGGQQGDEASAEWSVTDVSDGATVTVRSLPSSALVDADLSGTASGNGLSLRRLAIDSTFSIEDRFRVEATVPSSSPGDAPTFENGEAIGYFDMKAVGVDTQRLDTVTVGIDVDETTIPDGESLDSLQVYRYDGAEWRPLATTVSNSTIEARTSGFSTFAVVVPSETAKTPTATSTDTERAGTAATERTAAQPDQTDAPADGSGLGFRLLAGGAIVVSLVIGGGLYLTRRID
jgi:hypothetical protein